MQNAYRPPPIEYVNHILNSSPSKSAYSFAKTQRFKSEASPTQNNNFQPLSQSINYEPTKHKQKTLQVVQSSKEPRERNKREKMQQQKDQYFGLESKRKKMKDQYTIFPVRRDIDWIVKEMQELRFLFKTGFRQKQFINSQKRQTRNKHQLDIFSTYKADREAARSATANRSISRVDPDRFAAKKPDQRQQTHNPKQRLHQSDVRDTQNNNRRRSVSPFGSYVQSSFRNSSAFSFTTSPRNFQYRKATQTKKKIDFYTPFSQFGGTKYR